MNEANVNEMNSPTAPTGVECTAVSQSQGVDTVTIKEKVLAAMRTIYDPEIPVNIYDLGLIYDTQVEPTGEVRVKMTLTAPGCPAAGTLPGEVEDKIRVLPLVKGVKVEVVWDPPWDKSKMSEAALLQLGLL